MVSAQDIEISGLIDVGFVHNFNDTQKGEATRNLGPVAQNGEDEFTVTLAQLEISREADPVGFQMKLDFFNTADALDQDDGGDIEVHAANIVYQADVGNGLTIVAGKMDTVVGHDKVESSKNANMTHGLIYAVLPKTHLGVRGLYPVMDNLTVALGVNNGSDQDNDDNHGLSIEALVAYSPLEELAIDLAVLYGPETQGNEGEKDLAINLIATYDLTEEASVFGEIIYAGLENDEQDGQEASQEDGGVVGIGVGGTYDITDVYSAAIRYEYLDLEQRGGDTEYLWEVTVTGQAKLTEDLILRLEFRYDASNLDEAFDDDGTDVGDGDDSQTILGAQLLYTF